MWLAKIIGSVDCSVLSVHQDFDIFIIHREEY